MKCERVIIRNNKNEKLIGYFYRNTSKTLLVVCHGLDPVNGFPGVEEIFEIYYESGVSIFSFDFSGHGESEGKKNLSLKQRIVEIGNIIDYFSAEYDEIILYGVSLGGITVAIASLKFRKIKKIITVNGFFSFNPRHSNFFQICALGSFLLIHPVYWSELYYWWRNFQLGEITVPALVVYGEKDTDVNPRQSIYFYSGLRSKKKLLPVAGGDHALMGADVRAAAQLVKEWIQENVVY